MHGLMLGLANSIVWLQQQFGTTPPTPPGYFYVTPGGDPYVDQSTDNYVTP